MRATSSQVVRFDGKRHLIFNDGLYSQCGLSENRTLEGKAMIWWRWDDDDKCWQPTLVPPHGPHGLGDDATLIPVSGSRRWALLGRHDVRVNGLPCLPLQVLDHRDEVTIAGRRYCFSEQTPTEEVAFVDEHKRLRCARCLGRLAGGDRIVRCSRCPAHYHAACWTYDIRCQKCLATTDDALWVPESLN